MYVFNLCRIFLSYLKFETFVSCKLSWFSSSLHQGPWRCQVLKSGECVCSNVGALFLESHCKAKQRLACQGLHALFHSCKWPPGNMESSGGHLDMWSVENMLNSSALAGTHSWKSKCDAILNKMEYHSMCWYPCHLCCPLPLLLKVALWNPIILYWHLRWGFMELWLQWQHGLGRKTPLTETSFQEDAEKIIFL